LLELVFSAADVANTRIAISPLWEIVASIRVLKNQSPVALHLPWVNDARARVSEAGLDLSLLAALIPLANGYIPDFLSPSPSTTLPDLGRELASLRETPAQHVRTDLDRLQAPRSRAVHALYADPQSGLDRLAALMQAYWEIAIAPHWERILHLLDGEVLYRSRRLAEGGAQRLFSDLNPNVRWSDDTLYISSKCSPGTHQLDGRGLVLTPSVFIWPDIFTCVADPWQPTVLYPARGLFTLWEDRSRGKTADGLARVLGRTRTSLLAELETPKSTTELAKRTRLTAGGVSQHLAALQAAGFVDAHRRGRAVLYARTAIADALMD
jgi:DNA-binding transcriptional ArsR family regulator